MKIIPTLYVKHEHKELKNIIDGCMHLGIKSARFNLAKINDQDELVKFLNIIAIIKKELPDFQILFDVPYPGKKNRIAMCETVKEIKKEEIHILTFVNNYDEFEDGKICVTGKNFIKYLKNNILYYDLGQGAFELIDIIDHKTARIKSINSFEMYKTKSLFFGEVEKVNYSDYINIICEETFPDQIALSFVEEKEDLLGILNLKRKYGFEIISKIESIKGLKNIDEIIDNSNGIMLGRGDLCLSINYIDLWKNQQDIREICLKNEKVYYLATGFLESMENRIIPSRGEIIDLLYAVHINPDFLVLNCAPFYSENKEKVIDMIKRAMASTINSISGRDCYKDIAESHGL